MSEVADRVVWLFDVDDTLLDNDGFETDLRGYFTEVAGVAAAERYFELFEELRRDLGYADFIGALQRFRVEAPTQPGLLEISSFLMDYPFTQALYPGALEAMLAVRVAGGRPVVLSDGDVVFQPRKIHRAGIWDAVAGDVLIYVHKEEMLADVERRFPSSRYVLVDDKMRILHSVKQQWGERVTTVFVRQGRHATSPEETDPYPPADHAVASIQELSDLR